MPGPKFSWYFHDTVGMTRLAAWHSAKNANSHLWPCQKCWPCCATLCPGEELNPAEDRLWNGNDFIRRDPVSKQLQLNSNTLTPLSGPLVNCEHTDEPQQRTISTVSYCSVAELDTWKGFWKWVESPKFFGSIASCSWKTWAKQWKERISLEICDFYLQPKPM